MKKRLRYLNLGVLACVTINPVWSQESPAKSNPVGTTSSDRLKGISDLDSIRANTSSVERNNSAMGSSSMMSGGSEGVSGAQGGMPRMDMSGSGMMGGPPIRKEMLLQGIQKLKARLNNPNQNRSVIEAALRDALSAYFLLDMKERVLEFDRIEARVAQMKTKLQARLDRREEVVELQLKQMLHKADGIEFVVPETSETGAMGAGSYPGGLLGGPAGGSDGSSGYAGDAIGVGEYGGGFGPATSSQPNELGYDIHYELTGYSRLPGQAFESSDPLKLYLALDKKSDQQNKLAGLKSGANDDLKLKAVLLALHNFESLFHHLPGPVNQRFRNESQHSWRVALLPMLGQAELYKEYRFDEPWDSEHNRKLIPRMPKVFGIKGDKEVEKGVTRIQMLVGNGAAFDSGSVAQFRDFTDGISNTIAIVIANSGVPWTKPEDVEFVPNATLSKIDTSRPVGMSDGSVRDLGGVSENVFGALTTRAGGEVTPPATSK